MESLMEYMFCWWIYNDVVEVIIYELFFEELVGFGYFNNSCKFIFGRLEF